MSLFVKDKDFYSRFWRLTISIALQNVIVYAVNLADNVMLGRYMQDALSGVALCNQIFFLIQMLATGIGEGLLVFAARSWGERDIPAVWRITNIAMKLALGATVVCAAVIYLFPDGTLRLLSNDEEVIEEGVKYLRIIVFTYPLFAVTNVLVSMLRSVEVVRIGLVINCSALVVNVFLNYLLIFGHMGFPRLGTAGAAIATLAARLVELTIALVYVFGVDKRVKLRLSAFGRIDRALLRAYLRHGSPVLFSSISWGIAMTIQTGVLGHMSSDVIAASSIATTVHSILTVVAYGAASSTGVVIGATIGAGRVDKVKAYAKTLQILFLFIGLGTGTALFLVRGLVVGIYTVTAAAAEYAMTFLAVLSVCVVGTAYQCACLTGIVRAGGDTAFVLWNDIIFQYVLILPASLLSAFVFHWGPVVTFAILKSDQILKCFVAIVKVNRYKWIRALRPAESGKAAKA